MGPARSPRASPHGARGKAGAGVCCTAIQSSQRRLGQLCCPLTRVRPRVVAHRERPAALPLCRGRVDWGGSTPHGQPCPGLERNPRLLGDRAWGDKGGAAWVRRGGGVAGQRRPSSGGVRLRNGAGSVARPFRRGAVGPQCADEPTCPLEARDKPEGMGQ
jgi:hypothetical protein